VDRELSRADDSLTSAGHSPTRGRGRGWWLATLTLLLGYAGGVASGPMAGPHAQTQTAPEPRQVAPRTDLTGDEQATIALFERAAPSVVYVTSLAVARDFWGRNVGEIPQGTGSGFVWDDRGHVVTNFHVVGEADALHVTFADQSMWDAQVVGTAPDKDLAVLRIDAPADGLRPIPLGSSAELRVGQQVFAIGNPFGLDYTLTTGVVSAIGREIESVTRIPIRDVIQTDAAINPGNSGGPLLDSGGRLIGVTTAIYSPSGVYAGIGFAIPSDVVNWVVPELIAYGAIRRPSIGVQLADVELERRLGVEGALVLDVLAGSAAERAGIRPTLRDNLGRVRLGDVVVAVDGNPVRSSADLVLLLERRSVGEAVQLTILREGDRETLGVTLERSR
jgi:S1-C subfamily serine protease